MCDIIKINTKLECRKLKEKIDYLKKLTKKGSLNAINSRIAVLEKKMQKLKQWDHAKRIHKIRERLRDRGVIE